MTPVQTDLLECVLCHITDRDVAVGLLRFSDKGIRYFGSDPRCRDHISCRKRANAAGMPWPLAPEPEPARKPA